MADCPHTCLTLCLKPCCVQHVMSACTQAGNVCKAEQLHHVLLYGHLVCNGIVSTLLQHPMTCHIVMLLRCSGHVLSESLDALCVLGAQSMSNCLLYTGWWLVKVSVTVPGNRASASGAEGVCD
jgi:hypothetical protein